MSSIGPVDLVEAEDTLKSINKPSNHPQGILAAFPAGYWGEETGSATGGDKDHVWLVDPNDGTRPI